MGRGIFRKEPDSLPLSVMAWLTLLRKALLFPKTVQAFVCGRYKNKARSSFVEPLAIFISSLSEYHPKPYPEPSSFPYGEYSSLLLLPRTTASFFVYHYPFELSLYLHPACYPDFIYCVCVFVFAQDLLFQRISYLFWCKSIQIHWWIIFWYYSIQTIQYAHRLPPNSIKDK